MPKPPLPPEKYKGNKLEVLMTEAEYKAVKNLAATQSMTISKFVREVLRDWAKAKKKAIKSDIPELF